MNSEGTLGQRHERPTLAEAHANYRSHVPSCHVHPASMPRDIGPIEDLGWNQTGPVKRESAGILAGSAQIILDGESVDQGSISPSPPEITADFRMKLVLWDSCLISAPRSPRKAAMQGRRPASATAARRSRDATSSNSLKCLPAAPLSGSLACLLLIEFVLYRSWPISNPSSKPSDRSRSFGQSARHRVVDCATLKSSCGRLRARFDFRRRSSGAICPPRV
jgi:hypothetical protein